MPTRALPRLTARLPPSGDQTADPTPGQTPDPTPGARTSVRAAPDGSTSRIVLPAVTASTSAAGLQPISPPLAVTSRAALPSPGASHTVYACAEGLELLPRNASHRPSRENRGSSGVIILGTGTRRSVLVAPSSTHNWPRETNASSPRPAKAASSTLRAAISGAPAPCEPGRERGPDVNPQAAAMTAATATPTTAPGHRGARGAAADLTLLHPTARGPLIAAPARSL